MNDAYCNAPTRDNRNCSLLADKCDYKSHKDFRLKHQHTVTGKPAEPPSPENSANRASQRVREAVVAAAEARDVHLYTWTIAPAVITGEIPRELAAVAVSACRALIALPEKDSDREEMLREAALIGSVAHGVPPLEEADWDLARDLFDEHTLEQIAAEKPLDGWFTTIGGGRERRQ